eukprot:749280-Rhodomonas_salina.1
MSGGDSRLSTSGDSPMPGFVQGWGSRRGRKRRGAAGFSRCSLCRRQRKSLPPALLPSLPP